MTKKSILCNFSEMTEEVKGYFLRELEHGDISVYSENAVNAEDVNMVCSFSCFDNYLRCLTGQNSVYIPKPETKGIRVEAVLNDNDCIWATAYGMHANSLIKIDKESMKVKMIPMPYDSIKKERLFIGILKVKESLYLIPENSKFIAVYNISTGEWIKIDIEEESVGGWYYSAAIEVDGYVYLMPNKAKNIVKIACNSYKYEIISLKFKNEIKCFNEIYEFCGGGAVTAINKEIYFYSRTYNCFMKFNTEQKNIHVVRALKDSDFSYACVPDGDIFWMFTMSGSNQIIKYDISKNEIIYFDRMPKIEYNRAPFYKGTKIGNKIVFVPGLAEKAIVFDTVTAEVKILDELNIETYERLKECWIYSGIDNDGEYMYLFETNLNKFVRYNFKNNMAEKYELHVSERDWYEGQANKVLQMVMQNIEPPKLSEAIIEEY